MGIISGSVLGTWIAIEAIVATANKESTVGRMKGKKARFLMLRMRNKNFGRAAQVWCTYFEGEQITAEQLDMLVKHSTTTDEQGGHIVNMVELKQSGDINTYDLDSFFEVVGGVMKEFKFHKGACYANDRDGNRAKPERVRSSLMVFCQAETIEEQTGAINYVAGCDPETIGSRLENQFYKEPVQVNNAQDEDFQNYASPVPKSAPVQQPNPQNPPQNQNPNPQNQGGGQQQGYQQNGGQQQGGQANGVPFQNGQNPF